MRITININSHVQLNISPFMTDIQVTEANDKVFHIKLSKVTDEHIMIEKKLTGILHLDDYGSEKEFEISEIEDLGQYINVSCFSCEANKILL